MELTLPLPKEKTQLTDSSESGWRLNIFSDGGVLLAAVPLKKVRDDGYQLFLRGEGVAIANGFLKQGILISPTRDTYGPVPYYLRESGVSRRREDQHGDKILCPPRVARVRRRSIMIFFKSRCYNGGAQHRFMARITENGIPPDEVGAFRGTVGGYAVAVEAMTTIKQTYHGDVCRRCGKVVNTREKKA